MTIKVIGAGFGRTGTSSLQTALNKIGFAPCYHMREVMSKAEHIEFWHAAAQNGTADWKHIFQNYQATVDWPSTLFYKDLMAVYPDAKVILTTRDPERWYTSSYDTIYEDQRRPEMYEEHDWPIEMDWMLKATIWDGTFQGRFDDKEYAIDCFLRHNEEVKQFVPPERLLVYEVKEGWEPLCNFLNVTLIPDEPFPHSNSTEEFQNIPRDVADLPKNK